MVLGTGKQEVGPKLLLLMMLQQEKYDKWLFRVLMVVSELMVRQTISYTLLTTYCSRSVPSKGIIVVLSCHRVAIEVYVRELLGVFLCFCCACLLLHVPACACASLCCSATDGVRVESPCNRTWS